MATQKRLKTGSLLFGLLASSGLMAQPYSVQIGAFENTEKVPVVVLNGYGKVFSEQSSSGLTRILVGRFSSPAEAQSTLEALVSSGYSDAYVAPLGEQAQSVDQMGSTYQDESQSGVFPSYASPSIAPPQDTLLEGLDQLSPAEKRLAVVLDGEIRIKRGDQFLTLDQYRMGE